MYLLSLFVKSLKKPMLDFESTLKLEKILHG